MKKQIRFVYTCLVTLAVCLVIVRTIVWVSFLFEFKLLCTPVTEVSVKDIGERQLLNEHFYSCNL